MLLWKLGHPFVRGILGFERSMVNLGGVSICVGAEGSPAVHYHSPGPDQRPGQNMM